MKTFNKYSFLKNRGMKHLFLLGIILLQIFIINQQSSNIEEETTDKSLNSYLVKFNKDSKIIQVEATFNLEDSLLSMSTNGPVPYRWPQYIRNLKITDDKGKPVEFENCDSTAWIITEAKKGDLVHVNYEVILDHEKIPWPGGIDGVAFTRDWGTMVSGRSLFIMNGKNKENIQVRFKKPESWNLSTPWKAKNSSKQIYEVANYEQLQESILFAGTHEEILLERDGFTLQFVLGGKSIVENKKQYNQIATQVLDYYIKLMGGIPKSSHGLELSKVLVLINQSEQIDGEVIGNHISMFINPNAEPQSQMIGWFMFAHEFFHLWNGKTLIFQNPRSDWFKEGITNYYTIKALHQISFANEEVVKMILNNLFYQRYINDSGLGKLAPADAASGFDKDNHWGLIYGGGLFAGICMDMEIRNNTKNQKSLDDLMRYFYSEFGGTQNTISNADILNKVKELSRTDFTNFANSCIFGNNHVPFQNYLKYAGVNTDLSNKQLVLMHQDNKTDFQKELWLGFLGKLQLKIQYQD